MPVEREILIVEGGSTDGTEKLVDKYKDKARVFHVKEHIGKGYKVRFGLMRATGDIILIQDADLEYDPNDYAKLLEPILSGRAKIVYGSRFKGRIIGMKFFYRLANMILTFLANLLFRANITDEATCYKVFTAEVIRRIELKCKRVEFCPEITAKASKLGYKIHEVPISYRSRSVEEGKKISLKDGFSAAWTLIKYRFAD